MIAILGIVLVLCGTGSARGDAPADVRRSLQEDEDHVHRYSPLECNAELDVVECTRFSSVADLGQDVTNGMAHIPCGECVYLDLIDGAVLTVPGGIN